MYDFVDKRMVSLGRGGQFLIWSMRTWVAAFDEHKCPVPAIASAFARWNMIGGLQPFHKAMIILNNDGQQIFGFATTQCGYVSEHEAIMLSFFRAFRDSRPDEVNALAALLVTDDALHSFMLATTRFATLLAENALIPENPDVNFTPSRTGER